MTSHGTGEWKVSYRLHTTVVMFVPIVYSDDIQEILDTKLRAALPQVATDNGGEKLDVANTNRKHRPTPNIEVEEEVCH